MAGVTGATVLTDTLGVAGEGVAVAGTATGAEVAALGVMVIGVEVALLGLTLIAGLLPVAGDGTVGERLAGLFSLKLGMPGML